MKPVAGFRLFTVLLLLLAAQQAGAVRLKELSRIEGDRDHRLVGYGLVVGLSGSGDSERNRGTRMSLANTLSHFQVAIKEEELLSRNTAAVIVTATASAYREPGDHLDVQVSSLGDARSLQGGTLVLTPLYGVDEKLYAFAQGTITTGSYLFELNSTSVQKNHPTVGVVPRGATVERALTRTAIAKTPDSDEQNPDAPKPAKADPGAVSLILNAPDLTTAVRISKALATVGELRDIRVAHAGKITFTVTGTPDQHAAVLARVESLDVEPDQPARLVINERTGTLVAGGDITLGKAVISQDDLRIEINTEFQVSQPYSQFRPGAQIATVTVPKSEIRVQEGGNASVVAVDSSATVLDLVNTLRQARVSTKSMISIFQSLREAGALNAEIVVQ